MTLDKNPFSGLCVCLSSTLRKLAKESTHTDCVYWKNLGRFCVHIATEKKFLNTDGKWYSSVKLEQYYFKLWSNLLLVAKFTAIYTKVATFTWI